MPKLTKFLQSVFGLKDSSSQSSDNRDGKDSKSKVRDNLDASSSSSRGGDFSDQSNHSDRLNRSNHSKSAPNSPSVLAVNCLNISADELSLAMEASLSIKTTLTEELSIQTEESNTSSKKRRNRKNRRMRTSFDETMSIVTTSTDSSTNPLVDFLETMNGGIIMFAALSNGIKRQIILRVTSECIAWGPIKSKQMLSIQLSEIQDVLFGLPEPLPLFHANEEHEKAFHLIPKNSFKYATFITESCAEKKALVDGIKLVLFAVKNGGLL